MERSSYKDLLQLPPDKIGELVDGDLYASPRPRIRHAHVLSVLGAALIGRYNHQFGTVGGWWILDEPEVHLVDDVFVPDIAGWRTSTLSKLPDEGWIELAPDWVCEILSPSTKTLDLESKLPAYAQHGVPHAWILDPEERWVDVLVRRGAAWERELRATGVTKFSAVPFEDSVVDLSRLWI